MSLANEKNCHDFKVRSLKQKALEALTTNRFVLHVKADSLPAADALIALSEVFCEYFLYARFKIYLKAFLYSIVSPWNYT